MPTFDIPRKNFPLVKFLLETNWLSCIEMKSDFGMAKFANGFMLWQVCAADALLDAVVTTVTQPCWLNQSKPVGHTVMTKVHTEKRIVDRIP